MIKDNQKVFNRLMVIADAAITAVSFMPIILNFIY